MNKAIYESEFYCTKCGKKGINIPRMKGAERKSGHLKRLYCLNCREEVNHVECKRYTKYDRGDFLTEFYGKNFSVNGDRIYPYGTFKDLINKNKIEFTDEQIDKIMEAY